MSPEVFWSAAELLKFLQARGGQEFRAVTVRRGGHNQKGQGKNAVWAEASAYLFTARGDFVEATGPSEQPRQLSPERFLEVFGSSLFRPAQATGKMTDLGPLFGG